jgi:cobalt/nickel transport system permease protein
VHVKIDAYAHLNSPLHRWDPRCKLVALLSLMMAFASVREVWLLPAMLAVSGGGYALSRLPLAFLLTRLSYPAPFLLAVVVVLPLMAGETPLLHLGPVILREEGAMAALLIVARLGAILTLSIVLLGTSPLLTTVKAMRDLGLPPTLADMMLFFLRYLQDIADQLRAMQTAMRLRGFRAHRLNWRTLKVVASLAGSLLVRSHARSERVFQAMVLRGYGTNPRGAFRAAHSSRVGFSDVLALCGTLALAVGFVVAQVAQVAPVGFR